MPQPPAKQFSGIFVCYRRDENSIHAGRLSDKLIRHFGRDQIFMDIDSIEVGEDFEQEIEKAVGSCEILIAIIGSQWLSSTIPKGLRRWLSIKDRKGRRRIDDPKDLVRLEIAAALDRNIRVIPILVQGANMPTPEELPVALKKLSLRQGTPLSDHHWNRDVEELIKVMERVLAERRESRRRAAEEDEERQRREAQDSQLAEVLERDRREAKERESREAEQKEELRRLEKEKRARAEEARIRDEAKEAERQGTAEPSLQAGLEEQSKPPDLSTFGTPLGSGPTAEENDNAAVPNVARATSREGQRKTIALAILIACLVVLAAIVLALRQRDRENDLKNREPPPSIGLSSPGTPVNNANPIPGAAKPSASANRNANIVAVNANSNNASANAGPSTKSTPIMTATEDPPVVPPPTGQFEPKSSADADLLLPPDFWQRESARRREKFRISSPLLTPTPPPPRVVPWEGVLLEPAKASNTTGQLPEILGRRKVFLNNKGEAGNKIAARLKEYGWLEIVTTAGQADFAVHFYYWDELLGREMAEAGVMIITVRDPVEHVPRIIWKHNEHDSQGFFKRNYAVDKLTKQFISELKKLRGEK